MDDVSLSPPAPEMPPHRARFPQLRVEELDPAARDLAKAIISVSRSGIGGPYNVMLRSPRMAERLKWLLDYVRFESSLPPRLTEWAILVVARLWTCQVMWRAHAPLALRHGLAPGVLLDLQAGRRPNDMRDDEVAVLDFSQQVLLNHDVSDELFDRTRKLLGEQPLVDLMALNGTYVTVAQFLNVSQAQVPDGEPVPLGPLSPSGAHVH